MGAIKKSETFLLKIADMNDRDAFLEALRMVGKLMDRVNELEDRLKADEKMIPGHPEKFYIAEVCEETVCRHCGGCEVWERDH